MGIFTHESEAENIAIVDLSFIRKWPVSEFYYWSKWQKKALDLMGFQPDTKVLSTIFSDGYFFLLPVIPGTKIAS